MSGLGVRVRVRARKKGLGPGFRVGVAWIWAMTPSMFCLVCGEQRYLGFHCASGLACRFFLAGFFRACTSLPPCAWWVLPCASLPEKSSLSLAA